MKIPVHPESGVLNSSDKPLMDSVFTDLPPRVSEKNQKKTESVDSVPCVNYLP